MFMLKIFSLFLKFLFFVFRFFFFYISLFVIKFLFFFILFPFSLFFFIKSIFFFFFKFFIFYLNLFIKKIVCFSKHVYLFYFVESAIQFYQHIFISFFYFKNRFFRRYYFYRRFYRFYPNLKLLLISILLVEPNALLIKRLVQPIKLKSIKALNIVKSNTKLGRNFRIVRRVIRFFFGLFTLFYPFQLAIRYFFWYFTSYLLNFLRFLRRKEFLKTKKSTIFVLKIIIWIKIFFVWTELPFLMLFKPGFSKKYPQYEDIKPDTKVLKSEVWDFALSRDCYFDYDEVLNGYYFFHYLRHLGKLFFNSIVSFIIFLYFFILLMWGYITLFYFFLYIPFKFFYFQNLFTFFFLGLKYFFVLFYFVPIYFLLVFSLFIYFFIKFFYSKFNFYFNQNYFYIFSFFSFDYSFLKFTRVYFILSYFIFKLRALNYFIFNNLKNSFSLRGLISLGSKLNSFFFSLLNFNSFYGSLVYYNSSFIFKRIKPYLLRFNNSQFINYFLQSNITSRITPDQFKAFYKINLNGKNPVYSFEKLFDIEYSRLELEYELPYYWSFMRQVYSFNQGLLHPKFHVFGLLNYLKFYWNYFSFLNSNSIFDVRASYAHDWIQLLNYSVSRVFSYLMNDFFNFIKFKTFIFYTDKNYIKLSESLFITRWSSIHTKYYDKLFYFFWDYFDNYYIRVLFYYYTILSYRDLSSFNKINSFFSEYFERGRHILNWFVFAFYERIVGKVFTSINRFEDYYDMNFDKSINHYDFYLTQLKRFLGVPSKSFFNYSNSGLINTNFNLDKNKDTSSIRVSEYLNKISSQRRKDYVTVVSDFFSGSFSFLGHFYLFVRDNVFEFMAEWHTVWRDYTDNKVTKWYNFKKVTLFTFYFFKIFFTLFLLVLFILVFFIFFLLKKILVKIIKNFKKLYV